MLLPLLPVAPSNIGDRLDDAFLCLTPDAFGNKIEQVMRWNELRYNNTGLAQLKRVAKDACCSGVMRFQY